MQDAGAAGAGPGAGTGRKLRRAGAGTYNDASTTSSSVPVLAGRSARLPTFINYSGGTSNLADDFDDDKRAKYRSGWRGRLLQKANTASGSYGALLRSAIRAGLFEGKLWRRIVLLAAAISLLILLYLWRTYETHIEIAFYQRNWIKRTILPVPELSGTCFNPELLTRKGYNTSLASAPHYLTLNPGIPMRFDNDCYHFSRRLPSIPIEGQVLPEETIYHLYWRADLAPLGERQILLLQSIILSQNGQHAKIILWTNEVSLLTSPLLRPIRALAGEHFSVRVAALDQLAEGTYMQDHELLKTASEDARGWIDGDLLRVLVLYAYGGIWVDMDTLVLRDFRPLLEQEWVTAWDCYDKPYVVLNGAVMHFYQGSPYLCEMLYAMATGPVPRKETIDWGSTLYHQVWRRLLQAGHTPFSVLPWCVTDGRSCRLDNRLPDPFLPDNAWLKSDRGAAELDMKLESAFSVHLHNQWKKSFPKGGWVDRLIVQPILTRWDALAREVGGARRARS